MDVDDNSSEDPILVSLESEAKHVAHAPLVDPDAVEMRLLPLLDSEGRLRDVSSWEGSEGRLATRLGAAFFP